MHISCRNCYLRAVLGWRELETGCSPSPACGHSAIWYSEARGYVFVTDTTGFHPELVFYNRMIARAHCLRRFSQAFCTRYVLGRAASFVLRGWPLVQQNRVPIGWLSEAAVIVRSWYSVAATAYRRNKSHLNPQKSAEMAYACNCVPMLGLATSFGVMVAGFFASSQPRSISVVYASDNS